MTLTQLCRISTGLRTAAAELADQRGPTARALTIVAGVIDNAPEPDLDTVTAWIQARGEVGNHPVVDYSPDQATDMPLRMHQLPQNRRTARYPTIRLPDGTEASSEPLARWPLGSRTPDGEAFDTCEVRADLYDALLGQAVAAAHPPATVDRPLRWASCTYCGERADHADHCMHDGEVLEAQTVPPCPACEDEGLGEWTRPGWVRCHACGYEGEAPHEPPYYGAPMPPAHLDPPDTLDTPAGMGVGPGGPADPVADDLLASQAITSGMDAATAYDILVARRRVDARTAEADAVAADTMALGEAHPDRPNRWDPPVASNGNPDA